jgi:hypothetical protein
VGEERLERVGGGEERDAAVVDAAGARAVGAVEPDEADQ